MADIFDKDKINSSIAKFGGWEQVTLPFERDGSTIGFQEGYEFPPKWVPGGCGWIHDDVPGVRWSCPDFAGDENELNKVLKTLSEGQRENYVGLLWGEFTVQRRSSAQWKLNDNFRHWIIFDCSTVLKALCLSKVVTPMENVVEK